MDESLPLWLEKIDGVLMTTKYMMQLSIDKTKLQAWLLTFRYDHKGPRM